MAADYSYSPDEKFVGPEAPEQDLATCLDDIIAQKGEDHSTETAVRIRATWCDPATEQTMRLHKFTRDGKTSYTLSVSALGESQPVACFRYVLNGSGVTLHDNDKDWNKISGPLIEHEVAMRTYLRTANVTLRNGAPNALVNGVFWEMAGHYALTDPSVQEVIDSVKASDCDSERYMKQGRAALHMRQLQLGLPENLIQHVLDQTFFPQNQNTSQL